MQTDNASDSFGRAGNKDQDKVPAQSSAGSGTELPDPPRHFWLWRLLTARVFLVALMAASRWYWGYRAEQEVAALVNAMHAGGKKILPEDFVPAHSIPSENNAADFYLKAISAEVKTAESTLDRAGAWEQTGFTDSDFAGVKAIEAANAASLLLVRQATNRREVDWHFGLPNFFSSQPQFARFRHLLMMLKSCMMAAHLKGNDAEAIELIRDQLALGVALESDASSVIMHLVGAIMVNEACEGAMQLADVLSTEENTPGTTANNESHLLPGQMPGSIADLRAAAGRQMASHPAPVEAIDALIRELLNGVSLDDSFGRAMQAESARILAITSLSNVAQGSKSWLEIAEWPAIRQTLVECAWRGEILTRSVAQPNLPLATRTFQAMPRHGSPLRAFPQLDLYTQLISILAADQIRTIQTNFKLRTNRRAAAILLAIHLWQSEHSGELPHSLDELAPTYLPALPADPMRSDGQTFGYHPDSQMPLIYSVGLDGVDNGGALPPPTRSDADWRSPDHIYRIHPVPDSSLNAANLPHKR